MNVWEELAKPFADDEIEWRTSRCGIGGSGVKYAMLVPYIDSRAVMRRLDEVVGPANWTDDYQRVDGKTEMGFLCRLTLEIDGTKVTKVDGAEMSDFAEIKGGISDALKRAFVKFGGGRYLYTCPEVTVFGDDIKDGYPPKGRDDTVSVVGKDFKGWCERPKLSEVLSGEKPRKVTSPEAKEAVKGSDLLKTEYKFIKDSKMLSPKEMEILDADLSKAKTDIAPRDAISRRLKEASALVVSRKAEALLTETASKAWTDDVNKPENAEIF